MRHIFGCCRGALADKFKLFVNEIIHKAKLPGLVEIVLCFNSEICGCVIGGAPDFLPFGNRMRCLVQYLYTMEALINFILQFGDLNKQQIEFLLSKVELLEIKKNDYLSEAGKVPRYVAFVLEGVFRFCYYNNKGEEVTSYFVDEGNFVVDNEKFESQIAASEYVQAVTHCKVLVFNKKDWDEISDTIVGWEMMKANMVKKCLTLAMERRSPLVSEDATTRYLSFIEAFPHLINRIPLSYIASYLGVTQQSLSRIRRNIR